MAPFGDVASSIICMVAACSRATLGLGCYISACVASKGRRIASLGMSSYWGLGAEAGFVCQASLVRDLGRAPTLVVVRVVAALSRLSSHGGGGIVTPTHGATIAQASRAIAEAPWYERSPLLHSGRRAAQAPHLMLV